MTPITYMSYVGYGDYLRALLERFLKMFAYAAFDVKGDFLAVGVREGFVEGIEVVLQQLIGIFVNIIGAVVYIGLKSLFHIDVESWSGSEIVGVERRRGD